MNNKLPLILIISFLLGIIIYDQTLKNNISKSKIKQSKLEIKSTKLEMDLGKTLFISTVVNLNRKNNKLNKKTTFEQVESLYLIRRDSCINNIYNKINKK